MTKTKIIIIVIVLIAISIGGYRYFSRQKPSPYDFVIAEISDVVQEVSSTGAVTPAKKIELSFETGGRIKNILVEVGDKVKGGQALAYLNIDNLYIQSREAQAALELSQAKLAQLLAGSSDEEIKVAQTAAQNAQDYLAKLEESTAQDITSAEASISSAEITLANTEQDLVDTKVNAQNNLDQVYEDALDTVNIAYIKADSVLVGTYYDVQRTYFIANDQISVGVRNKENIAQNYLSSAKDYLDIAQTDDMEENVDTALVKLKLALEKIRSALDYIYWAMNQPEFNYRVSSADDTSITTEQTNINTSITNIITSQQDIASTRITNQTNINSSENSISSAEKTLDSTQESLIATQKSAAAKLVQAEGTLKSAQDSLALKKAGPRQVDIDLYQAQVRQSTAALSLIQRKITTGTLRAPISGTITSVSSQPGEVATTGASVITMIGLGKFQIEADIPESDIGKVSLADPAIITLDAFLDEIQKGKVVDIEPAETIIQGVVYYKVTIELEGTDERIKSGMTANIIIITDTRENVLAVPQRAVIEKNEKKYTRVLAEEGYQEQEVETGLMGSEGQVEIISGLKEGDKVITFIREKK